MTKRTFEVGQPVKVTLSRDSNHKREGIVRRATLEAHPHQYYLVTFDSSEGEWYQADLLEAAEPDTTQAVIEAARAVLALFSVEIVVNKKNGKAWLEVTKLSDGSMRRIYEDDTRQDIYNTVAGLRAAMDAHDEATESEGE